MISTAHKLSTERENDKFSMLFQHSRHVLGYKMKLFFDNFSLGHPADYEKRKKERMFSHPPNDRNFVLSMFIDFSSLQFNFVSPLSATMWYK